MANIPMKDIQFPGLDDTYTFAQVDATLTTQGKAADAKKTGDEISELKADFTQLDETAARIDGSYDTMTVGNAKQLTSNVGINDKAPYLFRTAGGANDIGDREEDTIVGGSVVWNQLISNGNFADGATGWGKYGNDVYTTFTVTNGVLSLTCARSTNMIWGAFQSLNIVANHKYLITGKTRNDYPGSDADSKTHIVRFGGDNTSEAVKSIDVSTAGAWKSIDCVVSATYDNTYFAITTRAQVNPSVNTGLMSISDIQLIDLTAMFGSTIADYIYTLETATAGAGVAWLKKYLPLDSYIPYCKPTIKSISGLVSHNMTGFNGYDNTTGKAKVVGGNVYQITGTYTDLSLNGETVTPDSDGYFTPAISGELTVTGGNSTTTCVHLVWDGERDGEHEAYNVNSYPLDDSLTLRGKLKLDANNDLYYDGDVYKPDGTVERNYILIDLGTVNFDYYSSGGYFRSAVYSAAKAGANNVVGNLLCSAYVATAPNAINDKTINIATNGSIVIRDDSFNGDAAAFNASLSGVYLLAEATTPTTETADPFQTPQVVDDWGTEEYVCTPDSDGVVIPVGHDTFYSANLKAKLEMAPDSPGDGDGDYIVRQTGGLNEYAKLVIPNELPTSPSDDGSYTLKATVTDGTATLTWVADT